MRARYEAAVNDLVERLKGDRLVLAAILCGSLAYDEVWEKSDVDLALIATDDLKESRGYNLLADGINVHTYIAPRSLFVKTVNAQVQGSFLHSLLGKGKLLFTRDDSITELMGSLGNLGGRDREIAMLRTVANVFPWLDKAEKWLYAKGDPVYSFYWVMKFTDSVAQLEVLHHGEVPGREVVQQAKRLNPELIAAIYDDLIEAPKTMEAMERALKRIRDHLLLRQEAFRPLVAYLAEAEGPRRVSEIEHDLKRTVEIEGIERVLEWMANEGLVVKLSIPSRLMPKSRVSVEEAAYTLTSGAY